MGRCFGRPVGNNPPTQFDWLSINPDGELRWAKPWRGLMTTSDRDLHHTIGYVDGVMVAVRINGGSSIVVTTADPEDGERILAPTTSDVPYTGYQRSGNTGGVPESLPGTFAVTADALILPGYRLSGSNLYAQLYSVANDGTVTFQESTPAAWSNFQINKFLLHATASGYVVAAWWQATGLGFGGTLYVRVLSAAGEEAAWSLPDVPSNWRAVASEGNLYILMQSGATAPAYWIRAALPDGEPAALTAAGEYGPPLGTVDLLYAGDDDTYIARGTPISNGLTDARAQMDVAGPERILWAASKTARVPAIVGTGELQDWHYHPGSAQYAESWRSFGDSAFVAVDAAGQLFIDEHNSRTTATSFKNERVYCPDSGHLFASWQHGAAGNTLPIYHSACFDLSAGKLRRRWEWRRAGSLIYSTDPDGNAYFMAFTRWSSEDLERVFLGSIVEAWRNVENMLWRLQFDKPGTNPEDETRELLLTHVSGSGTAKRFRGTLSTESTPGQISVTLPAGTTSWTKPEGVTEYTVELFGAGAAGADDGGTTEILEIGTPTNAGWNHRTAANLSATRYPGTPTIAEGTFGPEANEDNDVQSWSLSAPTAPHPDGSIRATLFIYRQVAVSRPLNMQAALKVGGDWTSDVPISWAHSETGWQIVELAAGLSLDDFADAELRINPGGLDGGQEETLSAVYVVLNDASGGGGGAWAKATFTASSDEATISCQAGEGGEDEADGQDTWWIDAGTLQAGGGKSVDGHGLGGEPSGSALDEGHEGGRGGAAAASGLGDAGGGGGGVAGATGDGADGQDGTGTTGGAGGEGVGYSDDDGHGGAGGDTGQDGDDGDPVGGGGGGGAEGQSGGKGGDGLIVVTYTTGLRVDRALEVFLEEIDEQWYLSFSVYRSAEPANPDYYVETPENLPIRQEIMGDTDFHFMDDLVSAPLPAELDWFEWDGADNADPDQGQEDHLIRLTLLDFQML